MYFLPSYVSAVSLKHEAKVSSGTDARSIAAQPRNLSTSPASKIPAEDVVSTDRPEARGGKHNLQWHDAARRRQGTWGGPTFE